MKRAEAFKLIQTKPETDPNEQKRFLNNAPNHGAKSKIESKIQNISLRMQELKERISKPNEDRLRVQAELDRAKESRTKALNSLYQNKVPVPKGVWTLRDCVDNGFVLTDEKGLPFPNTEKERYVTGRVYDWRPNTPGINSRPLDEEEQRAFFKALDEAGISKSDFYIGGVYGGCRFTVTEDDHVPNIGIREFVEESSILANDCRNFPRVMSLLNKPAVKDSIAIIKDMDLGIAEIRGRLSAADAACDSDAIEAARQEYNMLKNERHSLERERDCFDQKAFDDFAKAVGQIDNTSEKSL